MLDRDPPVVRDLARQSTGLIRTLVAVLVICDFLDPPLVASALEVGIQEHLDHTPDEFLAHQVGG